MCDPDHIYIYYSDNSFRVCFFYSDQKTNEYFFDGDDSYQHLKELLRDKVKKRVSLCVFMDDTHIICSKISVPSHFTEDDILQYIHLEQAKLFPMLEQDLYFDFFNADSSGQDKLITVIACNYVYLKELASILLCFPFIEWTALKITRSDVESLNLLPWRQKEKLYSEKRAKKKKVFIFSLITLTIFFTFWILCYVDYREDKAKKTIDSKIRFQKRNVIALEKATREYESILLLWKNNIKNADQQNHLARGLFFIDDQRPVGLVLYSIQYRDHTIMIKGYVSKKEALQSYIAGLEQHNVSVQLKSYKEVEAEVKKNDFELLMSGVNGYDF